MITAQLSDSANPERYSSFMKRSFDSQETSETESASKYYYKESEETPEEEESPAQDVSSASTEDDYTPKKYYVSREDFNNMDLSMFDDHETKKYYVKRAIREDEREVFHHTPNTKASNYRIP